MIKHRVLKLEKKQMRYSLEPFETKTLRDIQAKIQAEHEAKGITPEPWKPINPDTFLPPIWEKIREVNK